MKLIALGDNSLDLYRNTGERFPGGNAVNVAVHAARQGAQAEYLGNLGTDEAAAVITAALQAQGVAYGHCPVLPGRTTKVCVYDVTDGERRFVEVITGERWAGPIRLEPAHLALLAGADVVVSSCNAKLPGQLAAVEALAPLFAFDFGEKEKYRTAEYYDQVCHGMDLAMFSCEPMDEAAFAAFCAPLHRRGVVHVLATMGTAGQMLSNGTQILRQQIRRVDARDTMGAGDSFLAAFLCSLQAAGWQKGRPMPEAPLRTALEAGRRVSAENCMQQGGFGTAASPPEREGSA